MDMDDMDSLLLPFVCTRLSYVFRCFLSTYILCDAATGDNREQLTGVLCAPLPMLAQEDPQKQVKSYYRDQSTLART
eukprot:5349545-Pyramimonas_sp.AAC.2